MSFNQWMTAPHLSIFTFIFVQRDRHDTLKNCWLFARHSINNKITIRILLQKKLSKDPQGTTPTPGQTGSLSSILCLLADQSVYFSFKLALFD
jgi:hypothetical protein